MIRSVWWPFWELPVNRALGTDGKRGDLKICFIGQSGAGNTTFARRLPQETGIPHAPFDEIYWDTASGDYLKRSNFAIGVDIEILLKESIQGAT